MYKLWINVDDDGNITASTGGHIDYVLPPDEEFDCFFEVGAEVFKDIGNYKVVDSELTYAPKPPVDSPPVEERDLSERVGVVEKENEMNAMAIMELAEMIFGGNV